MKYSSSFRADQSPLTATICPSSPSRMAARARATAGMVTPVVADEETSVQARDGVDEPTGLGVVHGDRLLEEHRDAGLKAFDSRLDMQRVRVGDDDRIQLALRPASPPRPRTSGTRTHLAG